MQTYKLILRQVT